MSSSQFPSPEGDLISSGHHAIGLAVDASRRPAFLDAIRTRSRDAVVHEVEDLGELSGIEGLSLVITDRGWSQQDLDVLGDIPLLIVQRPEQVEATLSLADPVAVRALSSLDEAIEVVGPDGAIHYVNAAFERVNRYEPDVALGASSSELFANDFDDGRAYESAADALGAGKSWRGPLVARRGDGALIHQEMTVSPITDGLGELIGSVCLRRDISRQVRSEGALRESERRYRLLAENANDVIWTAGLDGLLEYCSPSVKRVLDYSVEEALDLTIDDFLPSSLTRDNRGDGGSGDTLEWLHKSGVMTYQVPQRRRDGEELWVETQVSPLRDGGGEMVGVLGVTRDITRRRQAEAERTSLEAQLQQAQKMEAIGRLAGGIAHDFNNILTGMTVSAQLLLDSSGLAEQHRDDITDIKGAAERATRLTRQLMAFSRTQVISPEVLLVNDVVSSFERMLSRLIGEDVQMKFVAAAEPLHIEVDPIQLEQVIVNLVVNARDAMPSGGDLVITIEEMTLNEEDCRVLLDGKPGHYVAIGVRDTGEGMSPETQAKIFEPFFTTKEPGKGTGLGLSTVYGIVKQNDGCIRVESTLGRGTIFRVLLPWVEAKPAPIRTEVEIPDIGGSETILVVEDEQIVRSLARRLLTRHGYHVIEAVDGKQALELAETHGGRVDLVLTDVVMPGMSGPELIGHLRDEMPALKVIFMSGYTDESLDQDALSEPGTRFIQKPFSVEGMLSLVRELVEERL